MPRCSLQQAFSFTFIQVAHGSYILRLYLYNRKRSVRCTLRQSSLPPTVRFKTRAVRSFSSLCALCTREAPTA